MRLAVLLFAFVALAYAQKACPKVKPYDGTTPVKTNIGYALNFELAKQKADGAWIQYDLSSQFVNGVIPTTAYARFTIDRLSTANGANAILKIGNSSTTAVQVENGKTWSASTVNISGLEITAASPWLFVQVIVDCDLCSKTAEFAFASTFVAGETKKYTVLTLVPDMRSASFDTVVTPTTSQTNWVMFVHNFTASDFKNKTATSAELAPIEVFFDVTVGVSDADSEIVAYFQKDLPPTTTTTKYFPINTDKGSWIQKAPFVVTDPGVWYFGFFTKAGTAGADVDYTIKAGFGDLPCSAASGLVANILLLALIPFTLFMNKF